MAVPHRHHGAERGKLHVMEQLTRRLWEEQDRHPGDRLRLFDSVADFTGDTPVLYPGSFVDIAPSFVFDSVTYVDNDRRAARFFADPTGVDEIISRHRIRPTERQLAVHRCRLPDRARSGRPIRGAAGFALCRLRFGALHPVSPAGRVAPGQPQPR